MHGHFSRFHVGGNNAVHGGVIPLFYDWHFGMVVSAAGRPDSRTAYLHVDYRKITPIDEPLVSRAWIDSDRRAKDVRHGDDDRRRRQRTIRGQRPDDQAAAPPALRGPMTDSAPQFTVPAAAEAVAAAIGDREFIIQGDRRYTYAQIVERSNRLAAYLHTRGLGCKTERSELAGHEVGQDLLGIYAYNGPEYVEGMLGAWRARVAPFNVNYRYVKSELHYLLADSGATALLYHASFAPASRRRAAPASAPARADPDRRRLGQRPGARRRRLRVDRRVRASAAAAGRTVTRRPVRALHRRDDRHAQGRAVAPARHLHDLVRRPEHGHRRASSGPTTRSRSALRRIRARRS